MEEEHTNLQEWELLSDYDINSTIAFEDITRSDYSPNNDSLQENLMNFQPESAKCGSFPEDDSNIELGFDGIEPRVRNFYAIDPKVEFGIEEINKGSSFIVDDSRMEVSIEDIAKGHSFHVDNSEMDLGFEGTKPDESNSRHGLLNEKIQKGGSFLVDDSKMEVGVQEPDSLNQNSDGAGDLKESRMDDNGKKPEDTVSDSSIEMRIGGDREKNVLIWWKLPLDILKLCASKIRPIWSIPIMAAVIGIFMVKRRLYRMKHKSRRIPLKISFDDKKATSKLLIRASHFNEVVVRSVLIIRSPLLTVTGGGVTPWPTVSLL